MHKYRLPSARLQTWDYGGDGLYFITICTAGRVHFFGEITDGIMTESEMGKLAERFWLEIPAHFPYVTLGNFVVMPNHVHGVLMIDKPIDDGAMGGDGNWGGDGAMVETPNLGVSTGNPPGNPPERQQTTAASEKWRPATLGVIVNQYKRMVTIACRKINPTYGWQSRYYDHIIRNARSFENIQQYIFANPSRWKEDKFFCK